MYQIFERTLESLTNHPLRRYAMASMILSALLLLGIAAGLTTLLVQTRFIASGGWGEWLLDGLVGVGSWVAAWFLFPLITPLVASLWLDRVIMGVEAEYGDASGREPHLGASMKAGLKFFGKALALNIVVLPLYFIPLVNLFVYYALNGYLLSREFLEAVLLRHMSAADAEAFRHQRKTRLRVMGLILAGCGSLPVINLLLPLLGVAMMAHLFETEQGRPHADIR
ncbi:hypothetical protein GC177_05070 [bacterium]|nr:hypothetical protein [bacterium]